MPEWFIVCMCTCVLVSARVRVSAWASHLANFQMGMRPRLLNQQNTAVQRHRRSVCVGGCGRVLSERRLINKEQDSLCSFSITLAMSKCLGDAMLSRRSIAEGINRLMLAAGRTFTIVLYGTSPLPLLPFCLLLSHSLTRPVESHCRARSIWISGFI